ncbi:MAG TPA: LysR family transcriptional regulator [Vineibacter sp.]|nr:LysR family transcriptional regulator [Vineibacter sp.]
MPEVDWSDLRYVLALARAGTSLKAARALRVNESTVIRRLARLEQSLDARLFERTRGRFAPTPAGDTVVRRAEKVELEVDTLRSQVTGANHTVSGLVRISSVPMVVNRVLVPALPRLLRNHPHLQIEAIGDPRDLRLNNREADVAVRLARPRDEPNIIARRIGQIDYAAYAAKRRPRHRPAWIAYPEAMAAIEPARWIAQRIVRESRAPSLFLAESEAMLQAAHDGLGKTLLPTFMGDGDPKLVKLDDRTEALSREVWLLVHPDQHGLGRISAVVDWIVDVFAALQSGRKPR